MSWPVADSGKAGTQRRMVIFRNEPLRAKQAGLNRWVTGDDPEAGAELHVESQEKRALVDAYVRLTKEVLPSLARSKQKDWPVREDHCFQRIVLDAVCGGVWYAHLDRPAYKNLTQDQALRAVELCHAIADGRVDLRKLNEQSLRWRGKHVPTHR